MRRPTQLVVLQPTELCQIEHKRLGGGTAQFASLKRKYERDNRAALKFCENKGSNSKPFYPCFSGGNT